MLVIGFSATMWPRYLGFRRGEELSKKLFSEEFSESRPGAVVLLFLRRISSFQSGGGLIWIAVLDKSAVRVLRRVLLSKPHALEARMLGEHPSLAAVVRRHSFNMETRHFFSRMASMNDTRTLLHLVYRSASTSRVRDLVIIPLRRTAALVRRS